MPPKRLLILATLLLLAAMACHAADKDKDSYGEDENEYYDYEDEYDEKGSGDNVEAASTKKPNVAAGQNDNMAQPNDNMGSSVSNNNKLVEAKKEEITTTSTAAPKSTSSAPTSADNAGEDNYEDDENDDYESDDYDSEKDNFYADKPVEPVNPNAAGDVIVPADMSNVQQVSYQSTSSKLLAIVSKPGILAGIVGGAIIGILTAVLLIMFIVYRMRKKDEGSYALEETKKPLSAYDYRHCPTKEFYA